jgi:signal transduction histidine kinase
LHIPPNLPALKADPERLNQILAHLLSNAVKFTPAPAGSACAPSCTHGGTFDRELPTRDRMEPDRIGHALEPFKQLDGSLSRRFEGVGLGLPLANALVGSMAGGLDRKPAWARTTVTASFLPNGLAGPQILA